MSWPAVIAEQVVVPTLADDALGDARSLTPGSPQRIRQIVALREQGWSLAEIAARFEVSRERVRQILRAHGGPDTRDAATARQRRAERLAEARIDELLVAWRNGGDPAIAASCLGLPAQISRSMIERFSTEVDRAARTANMADARAGRTYSDADVVIAMRCAAERLGRVPSAKDYAGLARRTEMPSLATVLNRMGGWSSAVTAAGLRPPVAPSPRRRRRWSDEACWEALRRVADELGQIPSVLTYERIATGRIDLPSAATLRNRLGRWSSLTARLAAERELSQLSRVRPLSAAAALAVASR